MLDRSRMPRPVRGCCQLKPNTYAPNFTVVAASLVNVQTSRKTVLKIRAVSQLNPLSVSPEPIKPLFWPFKREELGGWMANS